MDRREPTSARHDHSRGAPDRSASARRQVLETRRRPSTVRPSANGEVPAGGLRGFGLLRPRAEHVVLVRADRAVLVAVAHLVAIAERDALRGEERPEEWAHLEDLVADQL